MMAFRVLQKKNLQTTTMTHYKKAWALSFFALLLSLLSGCAQQPIATHSANWKTHRAQLQQLTNYHAQGVFGYLSPQERISLTFNWKNQADNYQLILTKMYKTVLKLDARPNAVTLITPNGKIYHGQDAAKLVQQLTGIDLPLTQMRNWLIGLPTGADNYLLNKDQQVAFLTKKIHGRTWEMHYNRYDNTNVPALPTSMILKQGQLTIKIKVSKWALTN